MKFFRNSYRVVPSRYGNDKYLSEFRMWWLPIWFIVSGYDLPKEHAKEECLRHSGSGTVYLGKLP